MINKEDIFEDEFENEMIKLKFKGRKSLKDYIEIGFFNMSFNDDEMVDFLELYFVYNLFVKNV